MMMSNRKPTDISEKDRKKSNEAIKKPMIIMALVLSSVAIIMSALVVTSYVYVKSTKTNRATVVIPKLAGGNEKTQHPGKIPAEGGEDGEAANVNQAGGDLGSAQTQEKSDERENSNGTPVGMIQPPQARSPKVAYLTFDDGPSKYTDDIVAILNEHGIHATFFVIGNQIKGNEGSIKAAFDQGNYIGLHSMSHSKKILYNSGSSANFLKEFKKVQGMVEEITGTAPWLIRAPYGSKPQIGKGFRDDIAKAGFKMWDWTIDSKDWKYTGKPDKIMQEIKRQTQRDVEVILLHEKKQTVETLPQMIEYLTNKGYAFAVYKPEQHFSLNFAGDTRL